jgi:hypothetical protein
VCNVRSGRKVKIVCRVGSSRNTATRKSRNTKALYMKPWSTLCSINSSHILNWSSQLKSSQVLHHSIYRTPCMYIYMYTSRILFLMLRPFHKFIINERRPCWCTEVGACKCVEVIALTAHAPCMPTNCIILFNLAWRHCPLITGRSFLIPYSPLLCADGHVADVAIHVGMWPYCRHFQLHIHFLTFGSGWDFSPPCQWWQTMRLTLQVQHQNCDVKVIIGQKWRRLE